jgi:hypothetical protein
LLVGDRGSGFSAIGGLVVAGAPLLFAVLLLAIGGGVFAATCAAFSFASLALLLFETNRDPVLEKSLEVDDEDEDAEVLFGCACIAPSFLPPIPP